MGDAGSEEISLISRMICHPFTRRVACDQCTIESVFIMENDMPQFKVHDMTCSHCVKTITKAVKDIAPDAVIEIDLGRHRVSVGNVGDPDIIEATIRQAGYSPLRVDAR